MTELEKIERQLSYLPQYLRYRAEYKIELYIRREENIRLLESTGYWLLHSLQKRLLSFDQWYVERLELEAKNRMYMRSELSPGFFIGEYITITPPSTC